MAHYLVTGGAGFIGSHLVERLLREGHRVRVLDDFSTGFEANLEAVRRAGEDRLEVVRGDVVDPDTVAESVRGTDGVFHEAAIGSVPRSVEQPLPTHAANCTGTLNVLVAMRDLGIRRLVFASSSSVYGALEELPKREDHPTRPISPYGLSKLASEEYLRIFNELYGMEAVSLRYYNVFGPRQNPSGPYAAVIPLFMSRLLRRERPVIDGDGEQSRDFTYVTNVVDANLAVMEAQAEVVRAGLFNVAAGGRYSLNHLLDVLRGLLGTDPGVEHGPPRPGDIKHSQADISRIRDTLGYVPRVSFEEGIRRTLEYFKELENAA